MRYVPNGGGLELEYGFAATDGTGYIVPHNRSGCKPVWPGWFRDLFAYTAHANGHDQRLGSFWNVRPDLGASYILDSSNGYLTSSGGTGALLWPSCSTLPVMGNQWATVYSNQNGISLSPTGNPNDQVPSFTGGPCVMIAGSPMGSYGYWVEIANDFADKIGGDLRHGVRVYLNYASGGGAANFWFQDTETTGGTGYNGNFWRHNFAELRLEMTTDGMTFNRLKVWVDPVYVNGRPSASPAIDFTHTAWSQHSGLTGIQPQGGKFSNFLGGQL